MIMGKSIQVECSATLGRKKRIEAFKAFVASNRKQKNVKELIALYALESGLRRKVVEEYLQLLLDSGLYKKHHLGRGRFILLIEIEYEKEIC